MRSSILFILILCSVVYAASPWQKVMELHKAGNVEEAYKSFHSLQQRDPSIWAYDDRGLLDDAEEIFTKKKNEEKYRLLLADLLLLRGRLQDSRKHFHHLSQESSNNKTIELANNRLAQIDKELKRQQQVAPQLSRQKRSPKRQREIEELEGKVDELTGENEKLKRLINEEYKRAITAQIEARRMRRLIKERKEKYRQYREDYQLFYRNLR